MKISNTINYNLTFKVEAFWDEEGGMGTEQYGASVSELTDALRILESAKNTQPKLPWIITIETILLK
jgi:hypothetical protein